MKRLLFAAVVAFFVTAAPAESAQFIPVANYSRDMIGPLYTSGGSSDVGGTSAIMFKIGFATSGCLRWLYPNYLNIGAGETTAGLSSITVQSSIQPFSPVSGSVAPTRVTFGGANSVTIPPGQSVWTDCYKPPSTLPAGQFISIRTYHTVPSGGAFPTGPYVATGSSAVTGFTGTTGADNYVQNTGTPANANGSNQLLTAGGPFSWASTTGSFNYGPLAVDGYAADGVLRPIVALAGDSIVAGSLDLPDSTGGAAVRSMVQLGLPYYSLARGNEQVSNVFSGVQYSQRLAREQMSTVAIDEYGTNDLNANTSFTAALLESYKLKFWALLANNGQPVIPVTLLPRVTVSNGSASPIANQAQNTNVAAYEAYNLWLRTPATGVSTSGVSATYDAAQVGVTIPTIIDVASYIETDSSNSTPGGPSAPNTGGYIWTGASNNTNYTGDGTHPSTLGAILEMQAFTATNVVAAINATTPPGPPNGTIIFQGR